MCQEYGEQFTPADTATSTVTPKRADDVQSSFTDTSMDQAVLSVSPSGAITVDSVVPEVDDRPSSVAHTPTDIIPEDLGFLAATHMGMLGTEQFQSVVALFSIWMANSDDPGQAVVDFLLSDSEDDQKEVLEYLVASGTAMGTLDGLAESVIKELRFANPADYEKWRSMISLVAVDSRESRAELLSVLPNVADEKIVAAALIAIRPGILPPAERAQLLSDISVYAESDNEEVSSAAVLSLGQWSAHDYTHIVEEMLSDGSLREQQAALFTVAGGQLWSDQIQFDILAVLNDDSLPDNMRMDAFSALAQHALDSESYADFYRFYEQHVLPLEQSVTQQ